MTGLFYAIFKMLLSSYQNAEFTQLANENMDMLTVIGVSQLDEECVADYSLSYRISISVGRVNIYSHEITVLLEAVLMVCLITGVSAIGRSVTVQLLRNVPYNIIASFFMMFPFTGSNVGDAEWPAVLYNIYLRKSKLISYTNSYTNTLAILIVKRANCLWTWLCRPDRVSLTRLDK